MRDCIKERKPSFLANILALFVVLGSYSVSIVCEAEQPNRAPSANSNQANDSLPAFPNTGDQQDPLQGFNRAMFCFNDKIDTFFLKPIATLYNKITPKPLNQGIHNVYNNINMVPTIANDILQLHFYQMLHDFWRLTVNTTLGIGGLFDVACRIGLEQYNNDFGLTLARYGWSSSTYLVLPFFGPSTIRDGIQIPVDYYAFSIYPYIEPTSRRYQIYGLGVIDRRAQLLQFESVMEEAALDKYIFVRNAYLQRRAYQIEQNRDYRSRNTERSTSTTQPVQEELKPVPASIGESPACKPRDEIAFTTNAAAFHYKHSPEELSAKNKVPKAAHLTDLKLGQNLGSHLADISFYIKKSHAKINTQSRLPN